MRTDASHILTTFQTDLFTSIVPALDGNYLAGRAAVIAIGCNLLAQYCDAEVDNLYNDNLALQALFKSTVEVISNAELAAKLQAAIALQSPSLCVRDVAALNDQLNTLFIEVQAYIEGSQSAEEQSLEIKYLRHLEASAQRRAVEMLSMG
ncbi:hypothetical protein G8764_04390 [Pseudomaricurvus alcaniphilus]|uniref:hypothetical protein n=1 Tax=Pseudomaricurvus alcaniphilus TaxID=1166482 RepID=UPI00140A1D2E|nr:hypothetical protein [Pseudomaricurvus alcaniphilus]NHN36527.1 hypothetical protein [Pseudomaricurvus alcaniphilus]